MTGLYLKQCNKEKERVGGSPELRVEKSRKECDDVVFCSARKQNGSSIKLNCSTISSNVYKILVSPSTKLDEEHLSPASSWETIANGHEPE